MKYCALVAVLVTLASLVTAANGFQEKTACFVDYTPSEEQLESEAAQWYRYGGGENGDWGGQDFPTGVARPPFPGYGGMDHEDMMERYGEMDEMEGGDYMGGMDPRLGGGYVSPDDRWDDNKRKRRRRRKRQALSRHSPLFLFGVLNCDAFAKIHIINVTLGYSVTPYCTQARLGCKATSLKALQVLHCQGKVGSCEMSIGRHYLNRCRERVNFAQVKYECIPGSRVVDICSNRDSDETDAVVINSPNYPSKTALRSTSSSDVLVTCECTLRAAPPNVFEVSYLRANLPGTAGQCPGDLLLLESPLSNERQRFEIEAEICGLNYSSGVMGIQDNILRLTFLGGAPASTGIPGFIGKFQARSLDGAGQLFHISCQSSMPLPGTKTTPTPQNAYDILREWLAQTGRTLPDNFDLSKLPANFFNMSREELLTHMRLNGITGSTDDRAGMSAAIISSLLQDMDRNKASGSSGSDSGEKAGILSGVVASLAAVIVIMGSIGGLYFYSRRKNRSQAPAQDYVYYEEPGSSGGARPGGINDNNNNAPRGGPSGSGQSRPGAPAVYSVAASVPFTSDDTDSVHDTEYPYSRPGLFRSRLRTPNPPPRRKRTPESGDTNQDKTYVNDGTRARTKDAKGKGKAKATTTTTTTRAPGRSTDAVTSAAAADDGEDSDYNNAGSVTYDNNAASSATTSKEKRARRKRKSRDVTATREVIVTRIADGENSRARDDDDSDEAGDDVTQTRRVDEERTGSKDYDDDDDSYSSIDDVNREITV